MTHVQFKKGSFHFIGAVTLLGALASFLISSAQAETKRFNLNQKEVKAKFSLDVPSGWIYQEKVLDIPLTLFGPIKPGSKARPVVLVVPSLDDLNDADFAEMKESEEMYRMGRRTFMEERGGTITKFKKFQERKLASGEKAHMVGYEFVANTIPFSESQYLIPCKGRLYYVTSIVSDPKDESSVEHIARSFKCE